MTVALWALCGHFSCLCPLRQNPICNFGNCQKDSRCVLLYTLHPLPFLLLSYFLFLSWFLLVYFPVLCFFKDFLNTFQKEVRMSDKWMNKLLNVSGTFVLFSHLSFKINPPPSILLGITIAPRTITAKLIHILLIACFIPGSV